MYVFFTSPCSNIFVYFSLMISHLFIDTVIDVVNIAVECMHFQRTVKTLPMIVQRQLNVSPPAQ